MWRAVNATLARMTAASSSRGFAAVSTEGRALREIVLNGEDAWDKHHKQSVQRLTRLLADGQRAGAFRDFDPQIMATALRAAIDSVYEPIAAGADPTRCANQLVELFDRAIRS